MEAARYSETLVGYGVLKPLGSNPGASQPGVEKSGLDALAADPKVQLHYAAPRFDMISVFLPVLC